MHECLIHAGHIVKYKCLKPFDGRGIGSSCRRGTKQEPACAVSLCGGGLWVGTSTLLGKGCLKFVAWKKLGSSQVTLESTA